MLSQKIKKSVALAASVSLLASAPVMAESQTMEVYKNAVSLGINGTYTDATTYLSDKGIYAPLRLVCEGFGYDVIWNDDRSIDIIYNEQAEPNLTKKEYTAPTAVKPETISDYVEDLTFRVNNNAVETPHFLYGGTTYVPVSFFENSLNCFVYEDMSIGVAKIYTPDYIPFENDEVFYIDGTKLTKAQYDDIAKFLNSAMGGAEITPSVVAQELSYYRASRIIGDKILGDKDFPAFFAQNKLDDMMNQLQISDKEMFTDLILKPTFYQYAITGDNVLSRYTPTEEDYAKLLENSPYGSGLWLKAKHILISKTEDGSYKKQAEDILKQLRKNPEKFDELMEKHSEDPGSKSYPEGYLFTKGQMVDEFYTGSLNLKVNEISDLVESQFGYHIIQKVAEYENGVPYTEVKTELHQTFAQNEFNKELNGYLVNVTAVSKDME